MSSDAMGLILSIMFYATVYGAHQVQENLARSYLLALIMCEFYSYTIPREMSFENILFRHRWW